MSGVLTRKIDDGSVKSSLFVLNAKANKHYRPITLRKDGNCSPVESGLATENSDFKFAA